jgi:alpha-tubulin suppressor-like RCC1 family protein
MVDGVKTRSMRIFLVVALPISAGVACNTLVGFDRLEKVDTAASGALTQRIEAVAVGGNHTCAILQDLTMMCWGRNDAGQLGVGDTDPHPRPVAVPKLKNVIFASIGAMHTCAVRENGEVYCWGSNDAGQLGLGTTGGMQTSPQRVAVEASAKVQAGLQHTCTELKSNKVMCWGANAEGELGDETRQARATPGFVSGISGQSKLSTGGGRHTCVTALGDAGAQVVYCWGLNDKGQLGIPTSTPSSPTPVVVAGVTGAAKVFVGKDHSCATLKADTSVLCWGSNESGQLGNEVLGPQPTPQKVEGLANIDALGGGSQHTCAFEEAALQMKCWGSNSRGQLGKKTTGAGVITTPTLVNLPTVKTGSSKGDHSCAIDEPGALYCWGSNEYGQLGDGLSGVETSRPEPRRVKF